MKQKPRRKLPAGWDVYTNGHRHQQRHGVPRWKYAVSAAVLLVMAGVAFYPWR